ncbi:MAG: hypothetical protein R2750_13110 [Bacteroidales bacterium]
MKYLLSLFGIFSLLFVNAQSDVNDTTLTIPMFYASYAYQIPGGDMANRFGNNSVISGGFMTKTRANWLMGADFSFLFGNKIKISDEIMQNLKTEDGYIIDMGGSYAQYALYERGYYISGRFGKLFSVLAPNPNSGIMLMGSMGYFQHKIRIEVLDNSAPQLLDDYKKGYDRLSGGFGISEFIGYMFLSNNRLLNFYGGLEFNQAWTKPLRKVNFDTRLPDEKQNRFDSLMGFRIGWMIPVFKRLPEKYYYF